MEFSEILKLEWRFLTFGFLMSFWSAFGQTFFISIFSKQIRGDLILSHGEFGSFYAVATLLSAFVLYWCGKLTDTIQIGFLSKVTLIGVCCSALLFASVHSLFILGVSLFALRLSGQGMMYMVYSTAITRRYTAIRGRALAIAGLGQNMGEAFFPIFVIFCLALVDWRFIWVGLAIFAVITFLPAIDKLTNICSREEKLKFLKNSLGNSEHQHNILLRRADAMKDWVFWVVVVWLTMIPAFWITGLLFHQIFISELKNVSLLTWMSNYVWYALAALVGAFVSGVLVDRFTAHSMAVVTQLPLLISTIFLWFGDSRLTLVLFFIFFGLCSGMLQPMINSLLAERYGTRWLGEIKSLAMPLNVLASAVSPILMGLMIDAGSGLDDLMLILAATSIYSICITLLVFNLIGNISPKKR